MGTLVIPAPAKYVRKSEIVDNLTSTSTTAPLSANMGKTLNEAIAQSTAVELRRLNTTTQITAGNFMINISIGKTGYTPVGIVRYDLADRTLGGTVFITGFGINTEGANTATIYGRTSSNVTIPSDCNVTVLYIKS